MNEEFIVTLTNGLYDRMRAGWKRERFANAEVDVQPKDAHLRMRAKDILS